MEQMLEQLEEVLALFRPVICEPDVQQKDSKEVGVGLLWQGLRLNALRNEFERVPKELPNAYVYAEEALFY